MDALKSAVRGDLIKVRQHSGGFKYEHTQFCKILAAMSERANPRGARIHSHRQRHRVGTADYRVHRRYGKGSAGRAGHHGHREGNNVDTGFSRSAPVNSYGEYRIDFLPVGKYSVEAVRQALNALCNRI
jgi:hypothetical protein